MKYLIDCDDDDDTKTINKIKSYNKKYYCYLTKILIEFETKL